MRYVLLAAIRAYWLLWPRHRNRGCIYRETCSHHVYRIAIEEGFVAGVNALLHRVRTCRPGYRPSSDASGLGLILNDGSFLPMALAAESIMSPIQETIARIEQRLLQKSEGCENPMLSITKLAMPGLCLAIGLMGLSSDAHAQSRNSVVVDVPNTLSIAFSSDSKFAVTGHRSGKLSYWDLSSGAISKTVEVPLIPQRITPGVRFVLGRLPAPENYTGAPAVWDVTEQKLLPAPGAELFYVYSVSRDQRFIVYGARRTVAIAGIGSASATAAWPLGDEGILQRAELSPDHRIVATAQGDHLVTLWDLASGTRLRWVSSVSTFAFSPDGRSLVAGVFESYGNTCRFQEFATATATLVRCFAAKGETGWATGLAYSDDGRWLASGHANGPVLLWDAITAQAFCELSDLRGGSGESVSVGWSPDGHFVFGMHRDRAVVWDVRRCLTEHVFEAALTKARTQSPLFLPKSEFETSDQYTRRVAKAVEANDALVAQYAPMLDATLSTTAEVRKRRITNSVSSTADLTVVDVGTYDADKQVFPVAVKQALSVAAAPASATKATPARAAPPRSVVRQIDSGWSNPTGVTEMVHVPVTEAPEFKARVKSAKVTGLKRLAFDLPWGEMYEVYNVTITLSTGKHYPFGRQEVP